MLTHRVRLGNRDRTEVLIVVGDVRILITRDRARSDVLVGVDAPSHVAIEKGQQWPEAALPPEVHVVPDHMESLLRPNRAILSLNLTREDGTERLRATPAA